MSAVFKALSHPVRREIVAMLQKRPMTSGEIAAGSEWSKNRCEPAQNFGFFIGHECRGAFG